MSKIKMHQAEAVTKYSLILNIPNYSFIVSYLPRSLQSSWGLRLQKLLQQLLSVWEIENYVKVWAMY